MRLVDKYSALKAFYYLMSIDGSITKEELDKLSEIGKEFLDESFEEYKDELIECCENQINSLSDGDEIYDVVQEGLDKELMLSANDPLNSIPSRLFLWDILAVAYADCDYSENEKRLINHIARILEIDKSILLEMGNLIDTSKAVQRELEVLEQSKRPYSEVKPLVEEIEHRKETIVNAAKLLISDEIVLETIPLAAISEKKGTGKIIKEKIAPVAQNAGEKVKDSFSEATKYVGEKTAPVFANVKQGAGKLFKKMKDLGKEKPKSGLDATDEEV